MLARLHLVAAADKGDDGRASAPGTVETGRTSRWSSCRCRTPHEVAGRLEGLSRLIIAGGSAPALVTAAVVHGELLALRPFGSHNGLVARAAERIVLIGSGLDPKSICPAEVGHAELGRAAYAGGPRGLCLRHSGGDGGLDRPLRPGGRARRQGVDGGLRGASARGGVRLGARLER